MGPFFALGDRLGLSIGSSGGCGSARAGAQRLGMVRLLDALAGRPRGAGHLAGGLLYMLNPYVVTYVGRRRSRCWRPAALPWLLLCVHRGPARPSAAGGGRRRSRSC
jgi:hypothetical protein